MENPLLDVARMFAEFLELQSRFEVSEQMDVATLDSNTVGLQNLRQAWQTVDGCRCEDDATSKNPLEQIVKGLWRFFARAEPACKEPCPHVPDEMLAVLLSVDGERLAIENEDATWDIWIRKDGTGEIAVQVLQNCYMTLGACGSDPAIGAAIENIPIMESGGRSPASQRHSECVFTGVAPPSPSAEFNRVS